MTQPYPAILFTVAIERDPNNLLASGGQRSALEGVRTCYIPGFEGKNLDRRNGTQVTLYGREAVYYKRLIDTGQLRDLSYVSLTSQIIPPEPPEDTGGMPINAPALNEVGFN